MLQVLEQVLHLTSVERDLLQKRWRSKAIQADAGPDSEDDEANKAVFFSRATEETSAGARRENTLTKEDVQEFIRRLDEITTERIAGARETLPGRHPQSKLGLSALQQVYQRVFPRARASLFPAQVIKELSFEVVTKSSSQRAADGGPSLVKTATTKANLNLIIQMARNQMPLLLEGGTGVGKSATIKEAATIYDAVLDRFNLSSRVGVDDLIGRTIIDKDGSIKYQKQPFTVAYEMGHWLLLDELNLAPDPVLQVFARRPRRGLPWLTSTTVHRVRFGERVPHHPEPWRCQRGHQDHPHAPEVPSVLHAEPERRQVQGQAREVVGLVPRPLQRRCLRASRRGSLLAWLKRLELAANTCVLSRRMSGRWWSRRG